MVKNKDREMLSVAMFGHKRVPSREGGIEIVVEELSARLAAMGHKVVCYNRSGHHVSGKEYDTKKLKSYRGVGLKNVPTIDYKGLAAMTASIFAAFCASFGRYDIVHVHAEGPSFMCWLPKLFRKKVIVTVHGLDHKRAKWGKLASAYIMLGEKNAVRFADEIIVLSENVRQYFKKTYGRDTVVIANGVDRPEKAESNRIKELFDLEKDGYVLFLGRLVPEKGLHYLIEAFRKTNTDKKLVIAGGSSDSSTYMDEMRGMAAGDDRIIFTGFVQGRVLKELYSNAYIYVLPSDLEGMPLSLLEAMSYGNCCVTSDIAECSEVVEDKAVSFRRGDSDDLRDKLQHLLEDEAAVNGYKAEAADFICGKYDWDRMAEETEKLYKMVLHK